MWQIGRGICFIVLLFLSYIDIRLHRVSVRVLAVSGGAAVLYQLFFGKRCVWEILAGAGIGLLFLLIGRITKESVGYGDSWGIFVLGLYLGFGELLTVLLIAFFLLAVFAVFVLCVKKMSRKCFLPFFPFLTCGYVAAVLIERGVL